MPMLMLVGVVMLMLMLVMVIGIVMMVAMLRTVMRLMFHIKTKNGIKRHLPPMYSNDRCPRDPTGSQEGNFRLSLAILACFGLV